MRITFYISDFSRGGGTERVTAQIASALAMEGHDVRVLSHAGSGMPVFPCNSSVENFSLHMEKHTGFWGRKIWPYIALFRELKTHSCDVFDLVDVLLALYALPLRIFFKNTRFVAWEHFNIRTNNGVANRDRARVLAAHQAHASVTLTETDRDAWKERFGEHCPVWTIANPIDLIPERDITPMNRRETLVIAAGWLTARKHFDDLLRAWAYVEHDYSDWHLAILGEGEERETLERLIKSLKLQRVRLEGFQADITEWYNRASIMTQTSYFEGLPMVLLEAQNHGLPIIAYDCFTGPSDIVDDEQDGFLVPVDDVIGFARRLDILMADSRERARQSEEAVNRRTRFAQNRIMAQWGELFTELMATKQRS